MAWKASVLVIANVTAASDELLEALRSRAAAGDADFTLMIPPSGVGREAREAAEASLEQALARMREAGLEVSGSVGDTDPVVAVHEAWDPARYDEIVVATLPTGTSKWLQVDLPHRVERITDAPVTHVVAKPPAKPHDVAPPPERPKSMGLLSPLQALGSSGRKPPRGSR